MTTTINTGKTFAKVHKITTIRMSAQTDAKLQALLAAGHAPSATALINMAIDRMYRSEVNKKNCLRYNNYLPQPPKKKAFSILDPISEEE